MVSLKLELDNWTGDNNIGDLIWENCLLWESQKQLFENFLLWEDMMTKWLML